MKHIKFKRSYGIYSFGDIAGFDSSTADAIIKTGVAEFVFKTNSTLDPSSDINTNSSDIPVDSTGETPENNTATKSLVLDDANDSDAAISTTADSNSTLDPSSEVVSTVKKGAKK